MNIFGRTASALPQPRYAYRVTFPKGMAAGSPRLRAALEGVLEEQLLDETEAVQGLRLAILREVTAQAAQFSQESGLTWQIADIEYGVNSLQPEYRNAKGAYREERDDLSEGDAPEQAAERIRLVASIVLRAAAAN